MYTHGTPHLNIRYIITSNLHCVLRREICKFVWECVVEDPTQILDPVLFACVRNVVVPVLEADSQRILLSPQWVNIITFILAAGARFCLVRTVHVHLAPDDRRARPLLVRIPVDEVRVKAHGDALFGDGLVEGVGVA